MEFSGDWTLVEPEEDRLRPVALSITVREALQEWNLEELLAALSAALNKQAERAKPTKADRARARAARLAAMATLAR